MDYRKIYELLVLSAMTNNSDQYLERHHIIPRCLGGSDDTNNLVYLTAKQHYIAHRLLTKIYKNNHRINHAFAMMSVSSGVQHRYYTSNQYREMKSARSVAMKINNPMKNPETAKLVSEKMKELYALGLVENPGRSKKSRESARKRMLNNNPNKGGATNHTAYPVKVFFFDGSERIFEYMKQVSEELGVPYSSLKGARKSGGSMPKYGIVKIVKINEG